jgi:hypothetical protein
MTNIQWLWVIALRFMAFALIFYAGIFAGTLPTIEFLGYMGNGVACLILARLEEMGLKRGLDL